MFLPSTGLQRKGVQLKTTGDVQRDNSSFRHITGEPPSVENVMYQSNRSFNIPPGHLTPFPAREGGRLITTHSGWGI